MHRQRGDHKSESSQYWHARAIPAPWENTEIFCRPTRRRVSEPQHDAIQVADAATVRITGFVRSTRGCAGETIKIANFDTGARPSRYQSRMPRDEQTTQRTRAPAAAIRIEFKLAFGTGYRHNQRNFG